MGDLRESSTFIDQVTGRVLTQEELAKSWRKKGLCVSCGVVKTHKRKLGGLTMIPLTIPGEVRNGNCVRCAEKRQRGDLYNSIILPDASRSLPSFRSENSETSFYREGDAYSNESSFERESATSRSIGLQSDSALRGSIVRRRSSGRPKEIERSPSGAPMETHSIMRRSSGRPKEIERRPSGAPMETHSVMRRSSKTSEETEINVRRRSSGREKEVDNSYSVASLAVVSNVAIAQSAKRSLRRASTDKSTIESAKRMEFELSTDDDRFEDDVTTDLNSYSSVLSLMLNCNDNERTLVLCVKKVGALANDVATNEYIDDIPVIIRTVTQIVERHMSNLVLVVETCRSIWILSNTGDENIKQVMGVNGALSLLSECLKNHLDVGKVQAWGCSALGSLAEERLNRQILFDDGVVKFVINAAESETLQPEAIEKILRGIYNLCIEPNDYERNMLRATKKAAMTHKTHLGISMISLDILSSLCKSTGFSLQNVEETRKLPFIIYEVMSNHEDELELQRKATKLLQTLAAEKNNFSLPEGLSEKLTNHLEYDLDKRATCDTRVEGDQKEKDEQLLVDLHTETANLIYVLLLNEILCKTDVHNMDLLSRLFVAMYINLTVSPQFLLSAVKIIQLCPKDSLSPENHKSLVEIVCVTMQIHTNELPLQFEALRALNGLIKSEEHAKQVNTVIEIILSLMKEMNPIEEAQLVGLSVLQILSRFSYTCQETMSELKLEVFVLDIMEQYCESVKVVSVCCMLLSNLLVNPHNRDVKLLNDDVVNAVIASMEKFPLEEGIQKVGCCFFKNSVFNFSNVGLLTDKSTLMELLMKAAQQFPDSCKEWAHGVIQIMFGG